MTTLENRAEHNRQARLATSAQLARTEAPMSHLYRDHARCRAREVCHLSADLAEAFSDRADYFEREAERLAEIALEMVEGVGG